MSQGYHCSCPTLSYARWLRLEGRDTMHSSDGSCLCRDSSELGGASHCSDLHRCGCLVEYLLRVELPELLAAVLAACLQEDLLASRVIGQELGDVVDASVNDDPGGLVGVVLLDLLWVDCLVCSHYVVVWMEGMCSSGSTWDPPC